MALPFARSGGPAIYLATNETSQKIQIVEYMIWLAKVFGSVIIVESGQIAKNHSVDWNKPETMLKELHPWF